MEKEQTQAGLTDLEKAARPLIKYLNENHHPHVTVIVKNDRAELFEGLKSVKVEDYIKD